MRVGWGWFLMGGCGLAAAAASCSPVPTASGPSAGTAGAPTPDVAVPTPATSATVDASPDEAVAEEDVGPVIVAPHPAADLFADLPTGDEQRERLCARGHRDRLSEIFCADPAPRIAGLVDLQSALGIAFQKAGLAESQNFTGNGREGNPAFVFLGHTTSLTARMVSPVNPRVLVFEPPAHTARSANLTPDKFVKDPDFVAMAFTRGEQIVELVNRDPATGDLRFFVVRFEQACNDRPEGFTSWELFGPSIESDWKRVTVYDDADLENTPADCNVCHQPNGHGTKRVLLMQAIRTPWTHFFRRNREGGQQQLHLYQQAHPNDETYGGIPGREVAYSDPALLEGLVENEGFMKQPITLHAEAIVQEIEEKGLEETPVLSIAWQLEFKRALKGKIPGVGYPVVDFVDRESMARASKAYRALLARRAANDKAPDHGDKHRPEVLFRVGLAPKPESTGAQIMVNVCRRCHNPTRNPKLTRARFDVDKLTTLPVKELARARDRLTLPIDSPKRMPPARFGRLSDEEIERVSAELTR
ncbi:MAG: c-type cytochrome, partial [Polyangiaceae bacterium]